MRKVEIAETMDILRYERERPTFRRRIIELKKRRRVSAGPTITLVFENRETVLSQVQEMIRAERIVEDGAIQHELDTYNALLPGVHELAATMLIELQDSGRIKEQILQFHGINNGEAIYLEIDGSRSPGIFETGQSDAQRISAVQFVRFRLSPAEEASFLGSTDQVWLVVDHPNYRHRAQITGEVRDQLRHDLQTV